MQNLKSNSLFIIFCLWSFIPPSVKAQTYTIDASKRYQTIRNFGASDCWTTQFSGLFPDNKRMQMAEWLFSTETDNKGQPKGIGLSLWRFNIGAGSSELGKNSYIPDITRRAECFQLPDGTYNWAKQSGQRWFLQSAKKYGVQQFLAFCISAPTQMTLNGLSNNRFRAKDGSFNIKPDRYEDYADFLATVIDSLGRREGINFQYLSPFNEPEWDWDGNTTQEGTPALMSEIAKTTRFLDKKLEERKLNTKILLTESGHIDYMYRNTHDKQRRNNQIETFFNPKSENYIGNLSHVPSMMVGHSYWTGTPSDTLYKKRKDLREKLDQYKLDYWQTEVCIMSNDKEIGGGGKKDLTMNTALYVARLIHYDLCVANASAWQWWLGMTASNYKDGLVYITPNKDLTDGEISDSKLLWSLGNFSRFVRPGAVRLDVSSSRDINDPTGLMISSYLHEKDKKLTIVIINYSSENKEIKIKTKGIRTSGYIPYLTSDHENNNLSPLSEVKPKQKIKIPARSVMTLVGNI
ncbi:xylanase [Bacteroidia bacterium]|nr:xylanase [Bacteroidia bacterium]